MLIKHAAVWSALLLFSTGCGLNPWTAHNSNVNPYQGSLAEAVPPHWRDEQATSSKWAHLLLSEQLQALIEHAMVENQTLINQQALWRAAVHRTRAAGADLWPQAELSVGSDKPEGQDHYYTGSLGVRWELDAWGRLSSNKRASLYSEQQLAQALQWAKYSLAADVARLYIDLISQKQQWLLARQREKSLQQSLQIIEDGYRAGIREALDVYSARAELMGGQADVVGMERQYTSQLKELLLLLGQMPDYPLDIPDELPLTSDDYTDQIASNLLARRPDVKEALYRVFEQLERVDIASAGRFPTFTISATYGGDSDSLSNLFSSDQMLWNFVGGITSPLFNAGKLSSEHKAQQETLTAQIANFRQVLLTAVKEAQQRLDDQFLIQRQLTLNEQSAAVSDQAQAQAFERYVAGLENLNTWLQAQRTAYQRRTQLVSLQSDLIQRRIDLHLAVGGDFSLSELPNQRTKN
jgi:outer membrane protein, multidrug efflux system